MKKQKRLDGKYRPLISAICMLTRPGNSQHTRAPGLFVSGLVILALLVSCAQQFPGGIGSRVFVVERANASVAVIDYRRGKLIKKIKVPGNLRHASMVFDADLRYGYLAVRSGHLIRIDLATLEEAGSLRTSENSIGLAISQDGRTIAVSEYKPGGITLVDVRDFRIIGRIPAEVTYNGKEIRSRVTGMVDGPENSFLCALMDANEILYLRPDRNAPKSQFGYSITRIQTPVPLPFDALITPNMRYYATGHMNSRYASVVDLRAPKLVAKKLNLLGEARPWHTPPKMPHMESWSVSGGNLFMPVPGEKRMALIDLGSLRTKRILELPGFPVYGVSRPDRQVLWLSFSGANDGDIHVLEAHTGRLLKTIHAGKRIYHMEMSPRGDRVLVSSNKTNEFIIYDTYTYQELARIPLKSPSGIFGAWRAFETGL